jgi:hypothetical protein
MVIVMAFPDDPDDPDDDDELPAQPLIARATAAAPAIAMKVFFL